MTFAQQIIHLSNLHNVAMNWVFDQNAENEYRLFKAVKVHAGKHGMHAGFMNPKGEILFPISDNHFPVHQAVVQQWKEWAEKA